MCPCMYVCVHVYSWIYVYAYRSYEPSYRPVYRRYMFVPAAFKQLRSRQELLKARGYSVASLKAMTTLSQNY